MNNSRKVSHNMLKQNGFLPIALEFELLYCKIRLTSKLDAYTNSPINSWVPN